MLLCWRRAAFEPCALNRCGEFHHATHILMCKGNLEDLTGPCTSVAAMICSSLSLMLMSSQKVPTHLCARSHLVDPTVDTRDTIQSVQNVIDMYRTFQLQALKKNIAGLYWGHFAHYGPALPDPKALVRFTSLWKGPGSFFLFLPLSAALESC